MVNSNKSFGNRGLSPLFATILLIAFAVLIGIVTMNWGKGYMAKVDSETKVTFGNALIVGLDEIDTPLKELQIKFITDKITFEEYIEEEKRLLNQS